MLWHPRQLLRSTSRFPLAANWAASRVGRGSGVESVRVGARVDVDVLVGGSALGGIGVAAAAGVAGAGVNTGAGVTAVLSGTGVNVGAGVGLPGVLLGAGVEVWAGWALVAMTLGLWVVGGR